jgi:tRNA1Val (adenine37-N6)-methyltransferase
MYRQGVSADVLEAWQLTLHQPRHGYRFSLDAFLLADFVPPASHADQAILDLGTGCGVVALLLARRFAQARLVGVELQIELVTCAQQNAVRNGLGHRVDMVCGDVRSLPLLFRAGVFGTVVCNPPYRRVGQGRLNPNASKAIARHEVALTLSQLLDAARHTLARRGVLVMIYQPSRLAELCVEFDRVGLSPRRLRLVHPKPQTAASMVLVEAVCEGRDALEVLPPLFVCDANGHYTAEMRAIDQGRVLGARHGGATRSLRDAD